MADLNTPMIDATVFMGMHHADAGVREKSLGFFSHFYQQSVLMNFGQIGICDAIVWSKSRELQDVYYPFMDVLHTDMSIRREGYSQSVLQRASAEQALEGLSVEKKLMVAQVLEHDLALYTHDPELLRLPALQPYLQAFEFSRASPDFPETLQHLYETSRAMVIDHEDFRHVG
jgi:hypothetical protein